MERNVVDAMLRNAMQYIGENGSLTVMFQGGEPTLAGAAFFRYFTEQAERMRPAGSRIQYALQTNGYHISEELLAVMKQYRFLVGVSLDGYRLLHDTYRVDADGNGTWGVILKNLKRLQQAGIETNALCVITAQAAGNAQRIYKTLKQLGMRYQQYILCLDPMDGCRGTMPFSITPQAYGIFLKDAFDLWYGDWKRGDYVSIRMFEDMVYNAMGMPCSNCALSGACGQYLVVEADGSAYPCDFYALDSWRLGNIASDAVESLMEGELARKFRSQRYPIPDACAGCEYLQLCRTGCFRDWEQAEGKNRNHYCQSFRMLLDYAKGRFAEIAAAETSRRNSR